MKQIWPKRDFSHKMRIRNFSTPKTIERIAKKCEKLQFLGIFGQKGQFWTDFGQNG